MEGFTTLLANNKKWVAIAAVVVAAVIAQWAGFPITSVISWIPGLGTPAT